MLYFLCSGAKANTIWIVEQFGLAIILSAAVKRYQDAFEKDAEAAKKFISVGKMPASTAIDSKKLAAFGTLALSLFNLDEALNKE